MVPRASIHLTGMLSQIGTDATADFVLTGALAGHEVTGSISGGGDVSAFPVTTFSGAMVICGDVEDNNLNWDGDPVITSVWNELHDY